MRLAIDVPESKISFMKEMFSNLSFIEPESVTVYDEIEAFQQDIRGAVREAKAYMRGEITLPTIYEVLDEECPS